MHARSSNLHLQCSLTNGPPWQMLHSSQGAVGLTVPVQCNFELRCWLRFHTDSGSRSTFRVHAIEGSGSTVRSTRVGLRPTPFRVCAVV